MARQERTPRPDMRQVIGVVEDYPELKSNQNFLALQAQLEGSENRIAVERKRFNESVHDFLQLFWSNAQYSVIIAKNMIHSHLLRNKMFCHSTHAKKFEGELIRIGCLTRSGKRKRKHQAKSGSISR